MTLETLPKIEFDRQPRLFDMARESGIRNPEIYLNTKSRPITIVITALNEEKLIANTLESLTNVDNNVSVVVVNNLSTDKTPEIVTDMSRHTETPIRLIDCDIPGIRPARRCGIEQVLANVLANETPLEDHVIATMDADTEVGQDYFESLKIMRRNKGIGIASGLYKYPEWVDNEIERSVGIPNLFGEIADFYLFLLQHKLAVLQTYGATTAFTPKGYLEVGGISPEPFSSLTSWTEDWELGDKWRQLGHTVYHLPFMVVTSPRRTLAAIFKKQDLAAFNDRWSDIRTNDPQILKQLLAIMDPKEWIQEQRSRMIHIIRQSLILPILQNFLSIDELIAHSPKCFPEIDIIQRLQQMKQDYTALENLRGQTTDLATRLLPHFLKVFEKER